MSDEVTLNRRVSSLDVAPQFEPFSKIIIHIDDDTQVSAGNDTGRVLEFDNPLGTQTMANNLLAKLNGYEYQPYTAEGALLDPAAEIGDGVSIKDTYGGIYNRTVTFSRLMSANISAPADEEIDHEYKYESPTERKYKREMGDVRATLLIQSDRITAEVNARTAQGEQFASQLSQQATEIAAKVSQTGGSNSSFGWSLKASEFALYAGSKKVFKATSSGVEIDGKITAREGYIGNGSSGFTITASAIYNNISSFGATNKNTGVYIGTNGIQLGKNFKVDSAGNLTAASGTFTGTVRAGSIVYGGGNGTLNGKAITGGSIGTGSGSPLSSGALGGIGGGKNFTDMTNSLYTASHLLCDHLHVGGFQAHWQTIKYVNSAGIVNERVVLARYD